MVVSIHRTRPCTSAPFLIIVSRVGLHDEREAVPDYSPRSEGSAESHEQRQTRGNRLLLPANRRGR